MMAFPSLFARIAAAVTVVGLAVGAGDEARAATVALDVDPAKILSESGVAFARYRFGKNGFDQAVGHENPFAVANNSSLDGGNSLNLSQVAWDFSLSYAAGSGYSFTLSKPGTTSTDTYVSGIGAGGTLLPTQSFNAIQLQARSRLTQNGSATMSVSDLSFSGAGLTTTGSLTDLSASQINAGDTNDFQWLVADVDLSAFDWLLTGKVLGAALCQAGGQNCFSDESIKFNIAMKTVDVAPVPLPAAPVLLLTGLAAIGVISRRRSV